MDAASLDTVLSAYSPDCRPENVKNLGNAGGFSGAQFWKLATPRGTLCLRRWPQGHPSRERLGFIHGLLLHVSRRGFGRIPVPLLTEHGQTFVDHAGLFWELTRWLPGEPDYHQRPTPTRLAAAMAALADFHRCAGSFEASANRRVPSPGLGRRLSQAEALAQGELERLRTAVERAPAHVLREHSRRVLSLSRKLAPRLCDVLRGVANRPLPLQGCIRDIWHDHVLFQGDNVTGLIDFGAADVDSVAGDLARLLGSLVEDSRPDWQVGVAAYDNVRPLAADELHAVTAFDQANVVLSGLNWIRWIFVQNRQFDLGRVTSRLEMVLRRLDNLERGSIL